MAGRQTERRKTLSCGGLPWRLKDGRLQVLLILQFPNSSSWGVPKGHANAGEAPEACAIREIREETGISVVLGPQLPNVYSRFRDEDKTVMLWLADPVGDDTPTATHPASEVADARWFDVDALPQIHAYQRDLITRAVEQLQRYNFVAR